MAILSWPLLLPAKRHEISPCSILRGFKPSQMRRSRLMPLSLPSILCCHLRVAEQKHQRCHSLSHDHVAFRRDIMLWTLFGSVVGFAPASASPSGSAEFSGVQDIAIQVDDINAYSYAYPLKLPGQTNRCSWVESRKPERYSSAAPLSPDARLRIVSERLDIKDNITISVSIGPPNPVFVKTNDKKLWDAKDVAKSVLSDRSTARMTTGQRIAELDIVNAYTKEVDDQPYWYYEYLTQKSPTLSESSVDSYRHSLAVTAERDGFLYSLNLSTLGSKWSLLQPLFSDTVASFEMIPPTKDYVPPYKDPWRFW